MSHRKPIAMQIAEGDPAKRGVHRLDAKLAAEPQAEKGLPECPEHLQGLARRTWAFWSEELEKMGLDHRPDGIMLEGACVAYANAVEADELVAKWGVCVKQVFRSKQGKTTTWKRNPAHAASTEAWKLVRTFCGEFGLSPVSRMRLAVEKRESSVQTLTAKLMQGYQLEERLARSN